MKLFQFHNTTAYMIHKKFRMFYLKINSSNNYAYAKLSKCNTKYYIIEKCWNFYWRMQILIVGSGENLRHRNTLELSVRFSLVLCKLSFSKLLLLFCVEKPWQIYSVLNFWCRILWKILRHRNILYLPVEINLALHMFILS